MNDVLSNNLDGNNSTQTSTDCCTVVCKQTVQLQYRCVCVCYIQFAGYTSVYIVPGVCTVIVMWNQTLYYLLLQMMIYHFCCVAKKERSPRPRKDVWDTEPPAKRLCFPRNVDAFARLPKHNNRPRCVRVVNSGIHAPHPLDLRGAIVKSPKPPILLNFEHLKHLGPCLQRSLSSLEYKTMDLNSTIPLATAAAFLAEVIMYLSSSSVIGQM